MPEFAHSREIHEGHVMVQVPCGLRVTLTLDSLPCRGRSAVPRCPPSHPVSPVVVCAGAGKKISGQETEGKKIEFIRAGDAVRTAEVSSETSHERGTFSCFYSREAMEQDRNFASHLLIGWGTYTLYLGGEEQCKYLSSYETKRDKQSCLGGFRNSAATATWQKGLVFFVLVFWCPSSRAYLVLLSSGHGEPLACLPRPNRPLLVCWVARLYPDSLQPCELYTAF